MKKTDFDLLFDEYELPVLGRLSDEPPQRSTALAEVDRTS